MKIQYYCYTRNNQLDYGDFILPDLSKSQVDSIRKRIQSITGDSDPKFAAPKWILIKFDNVIVWGCCCWNSLLTRDAFMDFSGRPVYGFFSIVITDFLKNEVKVPFDIEYFKELYSREIEPYWDSSERRKSTTSNDISSRYRNIKGIPNGFRNLLNTDRFKCQSLGVLDKNEVIAAALTLDNVSLLIDNDNIEQAINKKGPFMNCLSSSVASGSYTVKQLCPRCKEYVSAFTSTGICPTCQTNEQIKINTLKKQQDDMDKQLKMELEEANSKIQYLQYYIEEAHKQIKKKDFIIKVLLGVSLLLLLSLSYMCRDNFPLKLFENHKKGQVFSLASNSKNQTQPDLTDSLTENK